MSKILNTKISRLYVDIIQQCPPEKVFNCELTDNHPNHNIDPVRISLIAMNASVIGIIEGLLWLVNIERLIRGQN